MVHVYRNGDMFFESPDFTKISHGLLCKLLGNDDLCVQENNIFDSCLRYYITIPGESGHVLKLIASFYIV